MSLALEIRGALERAGVAQLPPAGCAYLADRMIRGGVDLESGNLGALRETRFGIGAAKPGVRAQVKAILGVYYVQGVVNGNTVTIVVRPTTPANKRAAVPRKIGKYTIVLVDEKTTSGATYRPRPAPPRYAQYMQQPADQPYDPSYAQQDPYANMQPAAQQQYQQAPRYQAQQAQYQQQQAEQDDSDQGDGPDDAGPDDVDVSGAGERRPLFIGATFPDLDSGARALVACAYRAMPRTWGDVGDAELATLGRYPADRLARRGIQRHHRRRGWVDDATIPAEDDDTDIQLSGEAPPLGWFPGFGPSAEAEQTYRALVADWEAFDRVGVGQRILPHLRQDVIEWREFRDHWKAGDIDSSNINGSLMAETARARRIRTELRDAKVTDPALGPHDIQAPGVEHSGGGLSWAGSVDTWAAGVPWLASITSASGVLGKLGVTPAAAVGLAGAGAALLILWIIFGRGKGGNVTVVLPPGNA